MNTLLTSNFPLPGNELAAAYLHGVAKVDAIAWLAPQTGGVHFPKARSDFSVYGFANVHELSVDSNALSDLREPTALYLSGGDPILFRGRLVSARVAEWLDAHAAARTDLTVFGASGGAMQLTSNCSVFRLLEHSVITVLQERASYRAIGLVPFEIFPHYDRQPARLIEAVREYSESVRNDIWCLPDGSAVAQAPDGSIVPIGAAQCLREGAFL